MKKLFSLLVMLILFTKSYAQTEIPLNLDTASMFISEFIQQNIDSIQAHTKQDTAYLVIDYESKEQHLKALAFYDKNYGDPDKRKKIPVWQQLDSFARLLFEMRQPIRGGSMLGQFVFKLVMKEVDLEIAKKNAWVFPKVTFIKPNAKYKLVVKKIYFNPYLTSNTSDTPYLINIKNIIFESKLDAYNSNLIKLNNGIYVSFRVSVTSYNGQNTNTVELFVHCKNPLLDKSEIYNHEEHEAFYNGPTHSFQFGRGHSQDNVKQLGIDISIEFED